MTSQSEPIPTNTKPTPRKQIIFCGAGGMYHYYLGVANVIQKYLHTKRDNNLLWGGISAGCFPALALSTGLCVEELYDIKVVE